MNDLLELVEFREQNHIADHCDERYLNEEAECVAERNHYLKSLRESLAQWEATHGTQPSSTQT